MLRLHDGHGIDGSVRLPPNAGVVGPSGRGLVRLLAKAGKLAGVTGFEPVALGFGDRCSTS